MASTIIEDLKWRYATKNFDPSKKLSEEKLQVLKEAFDLTATSYGLQPVKMLVISDAEIKKELVPMTMKQRQVGDASHVLVLCIQQKIKAEDISGYFERVHRIRKTSVEILEPFKKHLTDEFTTKPDADLQEWAKNQAYLALGNLLTVCAVEKIDSCPLEGFSPEAYDDYFNLKEKGLSSVLVLAVGYRSEEDFFSKFEKVRKGVEKSVIEIEVKSKEEKDKKAAGK